MFISPRPDHTLVEEESITVFVRMFGFPTPDEEREGRIFHQVTISLKRGTRALSDTSLMNQFKYKCNCQAKSDWCIHVAVVMLTHFSMP